MPLNERLMLLVVDGNAGAVALVTELLGKVKIVDMSETEAAAIATLLRETKGE